MRAVLEWLGTSLIGLAVIIALVYWLSKYHKTLRRVSLLELRGRLAKRKITPAEYEGELKRRRKLDEL